MFFWFLLIFDFILLVVWMKSDKTKRLLAKKWFVIASSGLFIFIIDRLYILSIGCSLASECYLPGWDIGQYIGGMVFLWFFIFMPLSIYKIISIFRL